jgi:DNA invertase Pin-like site-specific DNA recombinase
MGLTPARRWARQWRTWLVVFVELERDFIRSRTREALVVRRDRGVVLGRPRSTPDDVVARVVREGKEGKTAYALPAI